MQSSNLATLRASRPQRRAGFIGFCAIALMAVCIIGSIPTPALALYNVTPDQIPGPPGSVIRVWPLEGGGPSGVAFRILYRSTNDKGQAIPVSGAIFLPSSDPPPDGWPVIAWAHPTTGVMPDCAPSLMPDSAGMIWGLGEMLAAGYVVAATDYPGLGTDGIHPYLIGDSEARAVLDSVRAARNLENSHASDRFVVWGHSQGGQAALFTGQIARHYAPELKLLGVAAAAPATNLERLFEKDYPDPTGKELAAMALLSWSRLNAIPLQNVVYPQAIPAFRRTAEQCGESLAEFRKMGRDEKPLNREFLEIDPTTTAPWDTIMAENSPGEERIEVPVFIAQGLADTTVEPAITRNYGELLCRQGTPVDFIEMPGVDHVFAARDSVNRALAWMTARFRGLPAPDTCERR